MSMRRLPAVTMLFTIIGCGGGTASPPVPTAPASCAFTVSTPSATVTSTGATGSLTVTTTTGCSWTATSQVSWVVITAGVSRTGSGAVTYSVEPNISASPRTGMLTVAGQSVTVAQNPSVTFSFEGVIGLFCFVCTAGSETFGTGIAPGTRITGTYSFDPSTLSTPSFEPNRVSYSGVAIRFTVGLESVSGNDPSQARIDIYNGPPQGDSYSVIALGGFRAGSIAGRSIDQFVWVLSDTADLFASTSLPQTPTFFRGQYGLSSRICLGACFPGVILEGTINALTLGPGAATLTP
jgi:hypothetical protein